MVTRRTMLMMGLAAPLLGACGGGNGAKAAQGERVVSTDLPADDWSTATPDSQGVPASAMQTLMTEGAAISALHSMLVVRNGQLIGEQYFGQARSSDLRHIRSSTKTVCSLLIGQALRDGKISSTASTLAELLPRELAAVPTSVAGAITLQQVLQMRGGQSWDEEAHISQLWETPDLTRFALGLPNTGGHPWNYNSAAAHLLSPILADAYGMDTLALATRNLFAPLGIRQVAWDRDSRGDYYGSFGLQLRTRDLMKLGVMALAGGAWQGQQVVPASWIVESQRSFASLGDAGSLLQIGYGNLWWTGVLSGYPVVLAWGAGGQYALLVPSLNMVFATSADWNLPLSQDGDNEIVILNLIGRFLSALAR